MRILFICFVLLASCSRYSVDSGISKSDVFRTLKKLNYYEYAKKEELKAAKQYLEKYATPKKHIPTSYFEDSFVSISKRFYYMDGEWLWDRGGMERFLKKELLPYYEATGLKIDIQEVVEELDNGIANYSIRVNSKEYKILDKHEVSGADVWGLVPLELAKLLNDQLEKQGLEDRLYLVSAGNDGAGAFLNKKQYEYLHNLVEDKRWKPYDLETWQEFFCKGD